MRRRTMSGLLVLLAAWSAPALAQQAQPKPVEPAPAPKVPAVCTMEYVPVCGHDAAGRQYTYSNQCLAKAAGAIRIYAGTCVSDITNID